MTYENEIKNHEIYKFDNLNQNQILKLFNREPQTIFLEPNSKKHLTKIFEMIKNNFLNNKTNNYLNLYFSPNNKTENYNQKKEIIKEILKIDFPEEISTIIKNLEKLKTKIIFNQTLYTLENTTQKILYENYKLNSFLITKSELEKLSNTSEEKFILITEEEIYAEIEIYKLKDFQKIIIGNILKQIKIN